LIAQIRVIPLLVTVWLVCFLFDDAVNDSDYVASNFEKKHGVAIDCDYFLIAILMNPVEYKKRKKYRVSAVKCHLI